MQALARSSTRLSIALSPHGVPYLTAPADAAIEPNVAARIERAFEATPGAGIFHLGASEVESVLPAALVWFRELGRDLVTALCAEPELEELRDRIELAPRVERLSDLARATPPMRGAEYVTIEILDRLWREALDAFRHEARTHVGSMASFFHEKSPVWNLVGRVFFHLAENKQDEDRPFAFLATYTTRMSASAKPQHRPLGKAALDAKGDKKALLSLLVPIERAARRSPLVERMVESGEIYHPVAWTPAEALAFLHEVPALEDSGVVVRVPSFWNARRPPRVEARITIGSAAPSILGTQALLDFDVQAVLDGERLTRAELRAILDGASGLRLIKGRWIEIDRDKLAAVLERWTAESRTNVPFVTATRMLAGADADDRAFARMEAGPWLASVLEGLRSPEGLEAADPGPALHAELRPYQRAGVQWLFWLWSLGMGGCLADDMGLGKTIQVLALLTLLEKKASRPSLIVVPASLIANWLAEAARFTPGLELVVAHGSAGALPDGKIGRANAVLTTYGMLQRSPWMAEREWELVVLDEAQAIKNPDAKQARAARKLTARARFALTGTPVENRLGDLWSIFDFLSPGLLGTAKEFGRAAKTLDRTGYGPMRDLVRPWILRRLKSDKRIIDDLPDKTEMRTFCHLTKTQAALYADLTRSLAQKLERADGIERRGVILATLMGMKQICNHPSQWLGDGEWADHASGKLARLRELCEPIAERQEKVIVFTQFREMADPLARFLGGVFGRPGLVLHGGTPVKARKALVDAFQSELGPPFFVLSVKAGGVGLNLTSASHVIHFDRWWNPAVEDQATDRAYRIGQRRNVLVHKLVCRGTVEERIDALIASKKTLSEEILGTGGGEVVLTEMSNEALMKMVSLDLETALREAD